FADHGFEVAKNVSHLTRKRRDSEITDHRREQQKQAECEQNKNQTRQAAARGGAIDRRRRDVRQDPGNDERRQDPLYFIKNERDRDQDEYRRLRGNSADKLMIAAAMGGRVAMGCSGLWRRAHWLTLMRRSMQARAHG